SNDHRNKQRLAHCPAKANYSGAKQARACIGDEELLHGLKPCRAQAVSSLALGVWNCFENLPGDGSNDWNYHYRQDDSSRKDVQAKRRPCENRDKAQGVVERSLDVGYHENPEHKKRPEAIDDAWNGSQEFHDK